MPISSAIFVPLTITVALSVNKRTMRPRRASVFCDAGEILVRGLLSLLMGEL